MVRSGWARWSRLLEWGAGAGAGRDADSAGQMGGQIGVEGRGTSEVGGMALGETGDARKVEYLGVEGDDACFFRVSKHVR